MKVKKQSLSWAGLGYLVVLTVIVGGGAVWFRDLYSAQAPQVGTEFAPVYRLFLGVAGGFLAVYLGTLSGALGTISGTWWYGLIGLLAGLAVTLAGLSLLPWVRFPHDQYAAAAVWVFAWFPVCMGLWLIITVAGLLRRPRRA